MPAHFLTCTQLIVLAHIYTSCKMQTSAVHTNKSKNSKNGLNKSMYNNITSRNASIVGRALAMRG